MVGGTFALVARVLVGEVAAALAGAPEDVARAVEVAVERDDPVAPIEHLLPCPVDALAAKDQLSPPAARS